MKNDKLKEYCNLLCPDFNYRLNPSNLLFELQYQLQFLKSEIFQNIVDTDSKSHFYLDFVLNEILIHFKTLNTDSEDEIKFTLNKYNVSLEDVLNFNIKNDSFSEYFNKNYNAFEENKKEQKTYLQIQILFNNYFSLIYGQKVLDFVNDLKSEKHTVESKNEKIKWIGKPSQLGFIIGMLTDLEYIEPPKRKSNDINYTQFAKQIKNVFEIETTESTLSKYLNLESEKGQETLRKFEKENFSIPRRNIVS
tara:strand:- start:11863 stop:12612 length:750 start_codon:yes stop_codon:yes gene_type:complete